MLQYIPSAGILLGSRAGGRLVRRWQCIRNALESSAPGMWMEGYEWTDDGIRAWPSYVQECATNGVQSNRVVRQLGRDSRRCLWHMP